MSNTNKKITNAILISFIKILDGVPEKIRADVQAKLDE